MIERIYRKIKRTMNILVDCGRGRKFVSYLKTHGARGSTAYIVMTTLIGDTVYGMSFIKAFKDQTKKRVVVIGNIKYKELFESYEGIDELILLDAKGMEYKYINSFIRSSKLSEEAINFDIYNANPFFYKKCRKAQNPDALYQIKNHIFHLNTSIEPAFHKTCECEVKCIDDFDNKKERMIVINPYSTSLSIYSKKYYEQLAQWLLENNYAVYTNVVGDQKPIKGTNELRCSIYELFSIASEIKLIISIRSGILDFLISSDVNVISVYDNASDNLYKMYHLDSWRRSGKILEQKIENGSVKEKLQEAKEFVQEIYGEK